MKLGAKELRVSQPTEKDLVKIKRRDIYIICDNVLDTYNIGSIFRLADAVAAKCVYLCGQSETPPNSRISKASIGTDKWIPWEYRATAAGAIQDLRKLYAHPRGVQRYSRAHPGGGLRIIAIEQTKGSVDFRKVNYQQPATNDQTLVFIVGHETEGVSKEALRLADVIVEIPMFGVNRSLNVMVSLAIVLYQAINKGFGD